MEIERTNNKEELKAVMDKIYEEHDNVKIDFEDFNYMVKENGKIIGGITGWRAFNEIYVEELCIEKEYRNKGIGRKLLEKIEKEINNGKCDNINLITNEFTKAIGFYKKCGYEIEFKRENGINQKVNKYYMKKKLIK
jgi:ribosomal protein S18 acetylase RimI-like enzyme